MTDLLRAPPRLIILTLLIISGVPACAKRSQDQVVPGKTTVSELKAQLGEPAHTSTPEIRPQAQLLCYPDGSCFQAEHKILVSSSRLPSADEMELQTWRHRWAGQSLRDEAIPDSADGHGKKRYQLASKDAGMAVVYDRDTGRVLRVVKYGSR
jgi:hypothetical protein